MQLEIIKRRAPLGQTGLYVSALGLGAAQIGARHVSEQQAGTLLNRALDMGLNLIDTARGYDLSEERVGRHLSWRRGDFILCTKVGYGVEGHADWTPSCVEAGVERALRLMQTDHLDVVYLHSCPAQTLRDEGIMQALARQVAAGKVRFIGYSGEQEALARAAADARFDVLECSVNVADQRSLRSPLPEAAARGAGVVAKRPIANAPWRFRDRPTGDYAEVYWTRVERMALDALRQQWGIAWPELALRFTLSAPQVSCAIVGTSSLEHLHENVRVANLGPLPEPVVEALRERFQVCDASSAEPWVGQI